MKKTAVLIAALALGLVARTAAADAPPTDAVMIDHTKVEATFAKGGAAFVANSSYKVQAGKRESGGKVEIHATDTDIFYVTEGSATFVTGGKAIDPKTTKPGEQLADKMEGGTVHHLTKGDVIVIPSGVPHQFTAVTASPFLYFVVKVTK